MPKAYISTFKEAPEEGRVRLDVTFVSRPEKAACWDTRELAEADCVIFDRKDIVIPSAEGGTHVCKGFKVEERAPGEFVVYCEGPFILRTTTP